MPQVGGRNARAGDPRRVSRIRVGLGVADDLTGAASVFFVNDAEADAPVLQMSSGADGGIALGADSTLEDNAISVGSAGSERRVAYVAAGTAATDAVNLGQFDQFKLDAADAVDEQLEVLINEVAARVDELIARLDALNP